MAAAQWINDIPQTDLVDFSICPSTASAFPWSFATGQDLHESTCGGADYELVIDRTTLASIITDVT